MPFARHSLKKYFDEILKRFHTWLFELRLEIFTTAFFLKTIIET